MKTERAEVKSKSKVVGHAEYAVYDSIDEARSKEGDESVLSLINAQTRTNEMNRIRGEATTRPSKKRLMKLAMAEISPTEFAEIAGDPAAIDNLIQTKMDAIEARLAASGPDDEPDEGDEESTD